MALLPTFAYRPVVDVILHIENLTREMPMETLCPDFISIGLHLLCQAWTPLPLIHRLYIMSHHHQAIGDRTSYDDWLVSYTATQYFYEMKYENCQLFFYQYLIWIKFKKYFDNQVKSIAGYLNPKRLFVIHMSFPIAKEWVHFGTVNGLIVISYDIKAIQLYLWFWGNFHSELQL